MVILLKLLEQKYDWLIVQFYLVLTTAHWASPKIAVAMKQPKAKGQRGGASRTKLAMREV